MAGTDRLRTDRLRVAVVGAGAFGRNHLRVYRELAGLGRAVELAAVVEPETKARETAAAAFGVRGFATVAECVAAAKAEGWTLDAASVCVPTVHHRVVAEELLTAGVDVLIEKPLAASLADADAILATAERYGRVVQVGHLERFNPAVTAVRGLLNRPMFFEAHRLSIFTLRSLDVDVVLDLMIHDLDVVLSLVGSEVREVRAVGLPVLSPKVDIANVRLEFENGCIANFTASRVSTERVRKLRFFQPRQYVSIDFARQDLLVIDAPEMPGGMSALAAAAAAAAGSGAGSGSGLQHPTAGLNLRKMAVEAGEPLRLEIEAFLGVVRGGGAPVVSGMDGRRALKVALEINAAIAAHAVRAGL